MARIRHAFIDVHLATRSFISLKTLTLKRAFGVEAATTMFTRVGTYNIKDTSCHTYVVTYAEEPEEQNS